jgi:3-oxoadipate enol-lactonase
VPEPVAPGGAVPFVGEIHSVEGPSGPISFRRFGAGDPLVLLHPLALSGAVWGSFAERLSEHFDVIAPDARGHGDSGWAGDAFSADDLADDIEALLDGLGLQSAHLLGMSMGGSVGIAFAGSRPDRVRRLLLADTTAWYGEQAPVVWAERAERALATPRPRQVAFQVDRWFTETFRAHHPEEVVRVVDVFVRTDSRAHAQASRALGGLDARELVPAITAPTLVLTGEQDYATPPEMGRYVADSLRAGRALVLKDLRHLSLIEAPGLAELVTAHLAGRPLPDPAQLDASCGCPAAAHPHTSEVNA